MKLYLFKGWRKARRPKWMERLSREERRNLARNLRAILEPKAVIDQRSAGNARPE